MKTDVRGHDTVWLCVRRAGPHEYHMQGIGVESEGTTAEQMAVGMCRDDSYFIYPVKVNIALPEKPVEAAGGYWPLAGKEARDIPDDAPSIGALLRALASEYPPPAAKKGTRARASSKKSAAPKTAVVVKRPASKKASKKRD